MSKRVWLLPALAMLLIAMGSGAAFAVPSLGGPTGIVSVPTALVPPQGQMGAAVSWQSIDMYQRSDSGDFSVWSLQVLGGVANGAELWAAYSTADDAWDTNTWGLGGKFQFAQEPLSPATLAFGASFQNSSGDRLVARGLGMYKSDVDDDVWKVYLVASKDFTPVGLTTEWAAGTRIVGTAGLLWARRSRDETVPDNLGAPQRSSGDDDLLEPFIGVEFLGTGGTALGLEYRWKDSDLDEKAVFSAVLRQCFPNGFFGELGTTNADELGFGTDNQDFFLRGGYVFTFGVY